MHLTRHTDFALRVLYYLGLHPDRRVSIGEISSAFGASRNHLVKVVQHLSREGWVKTTRGRSGGVSLAVAPHDIPIGRVVARVEPDFRLVECFDPESNTCPIAAICGVQGIIEKALTAFFEELDRYTLADVLIDRETLLGALNGHGSRKGPTRGSPEPGDLG